MKSLWRNNLVYTFIWLIIGLIGSGLIVWSAFPATKTSLKLLLVSSPILFLLSILCLAILGVITIAAIAATTVKKEGGEKEKKEFLGGIIRNVPANQAWALRNAWYSDIGDEEREPRGYVEKREGWRFQIPYVWHIDMGIVDLSPQPRDPESITVNTKDNQTAIIDWRIVTIVSDAVKFVVKVNGNREEFENQRATVIFNQLSSQKTQKQLTKFTATELADWADTAKKEFNQKMEYLGIQAVALEIQKILMPEEIRAAAEYATVTKKRKEVAKTKGEELGIIIEATKADPTKLVIADMARDALMNIVDPVVNAFRTQRETKEEKGGKEK